MPIAIKSVVALALIAACTAWASSPVDDKAPANSDPSQIVIRLERGIGCPGCPEYSVIIRGDHSVEYEGRSFVLVKGKLKWVIPQADVIALVNELRKAEYFQLKDEYGVFAYDGMNDKSVATITNRTKSVAVYGGPTCKPGAAADTCVPDQLRALHDSID